MKTCPCHSSLDYEKCCKPFHDGIPAPTALALMRSRYSAYALHLIDYIIATTHPTHVDFRLKRNIWKRQLKDSYQNTQFLNLTILDVINGPYESFVTFKADLKNENQDGSFTEKSRFLKEGDRWFYVDGVISH